MIVLYCIVLYCVDYAGELKSLHDACHRMISTSGLDLIDESSSSDDDNSSEGDSVDDSDSDGDAAASMSRRVHVCVEVCTAQHRRIAKVLKEWDISSNGE